LTYKFGLVSTRIFVVLKSTTFAELAEVLGVTGSWFRRRSDGCQGWPGWGAADVPGTFLTNVEQVMRAHGCTLDGSRIAVSGCCRCTCDLYESTLGCS